MMSDVRPTTEQVAFEAPAPGFWELETTHHGCRPLSMFVRESYKRAFESGIKVLVERYGLPLTGVRAELVNGCAYVRPTAVGEGSKPKPPPPDIVMKLIARLHPEMRRRARTAAQAWDEKRWRLEVDQWFDHDRAVVVARNHELQGIDVSALDDEQLASHIQELRHHVETQARRNMETHGGDLMPVGDFLAHCEGWGIDPAAAADLLQGSSPATVETAQLLAPVAEALARSETRPHTVEQVRRLDPAARTAVDTWLELHGWRLMTSDDIDRPTLAEMPALQLSALLSAVDPSASPTPDATPLRQQVPADQRPLFDELLADARYGSRQRDDIRGLCWDWPGGLLRRSLLDAGRRLVGRGLLLDAEHIVELTPNEVDRLIRQGTGPSAAEAAQRADQRDLVEASPPPRSLGDPEEPPPLSAFPAAMARSTAALMTTLAADGTAPRDEALHGVGIGTETYRGRACVAGNAAEALERLEPGDILVTSFTGPSYNSLFPLLGALVVEEGGPLCHAAIMAREFGLPAVVGTARATIDITDGALAEVDPTNGVVHVL